MTGMDEATAASVATTQQLQHTQEHEHKQQQQQQHHHHRHQQLANKQQLQQQQQQQQQMKQDLEQLQPKLKLESDAIHKLRVLTFNVNGLRTMAAGIGGIEKLLGALGADIVCFQEHKMRREDLDTTTAIVPGWESFFAFNRASNRGYSGVATYVRRETAGVPVHAEEGLTGFLALDRSLPKSRAPQALGPPWNNYAADALESIDAEGRCVVTDHGAFVLFNVYGPCVGPVNPGDGAGDRSTQRTQYKRMYFEALDVRLRRSLAAGRRVLLVGDLNVCLDPIDSCDPGAASLEAFVKDRWDRRWLRGLVEAGGGPFVDTFRVFHAGRRNAYTCWNTASGARTNNYGSRIDLLLAANGGSHGSVAQREWIVDGDIMPDFQGSDHCPAWVDVAVALPLQATATAPPSSSRYLFAAQPTKQAKMDAFFGRRKTADGGVGGAAAGLAAAGVALCGAAGSTAAAQARGGGGGGDGGGGGGGSIGGVGGDSASATVGLCSGPSTDMDAPTAPSNGMDAAVQSTGQHVALHARLHAPTPSATHAPTPSATHAAALSATPRSSSAGARAPPPARSAVGGASKTAPASTCAAPGHKRGGDATGQPASKKARGRGGTQLSLRAFMPRREPAPADGGAAPPPALVQTAGETGTPDATVRTTADMEGMDTPAGSCARSTAAHAARSQGPLEAATHTSALQSQPSCGGASARAASSAPTLGAAPAASTSTSAPQAPAPRNPFLGRAGIPRCAHGESCIARVVKKRGPNHGREFYCCARAAGPPPQGRCNTFIWVVPRAEETAAARRPAAAFTAGMLSTGMLQPVVWYEGSYDDEQPGAEHPETDTQPDTGAKPATAWKQQAGWKPEVEIKLEAGAKPEADVKPDTHKGFDHVD